MTVLEGAVRGLGGEAPEILVTWPDYDVDAPHSGVLLRATGARLRLAPRHGERSSRTVRELLGGAVGALVSTDPFDAEVFERCPRLRVIARVGVGVDSIDLDAATRHGVVVTVTPGANEETVADHTMALMLAAVRRVAEHDRAVRAGEWRRTGDRLARSLSGATVGLVGLGRIGRLVATRLRGFGVDLVSHDPRVRDDDVARMVSFEELLRVSDVVSLHAPLTAATRALIGPQELAAMRPGAILVNTARGGLVDEAALFDALAGGHIGAAALDVFAVEPPLASPLLRRDDVVLSPHVGGLSLNSVDEMLARASASIADVLADRVPACVANPAVLGGAALARAGS